MNCHEDVALEYYSEFKQALASCDERSGVIADPSHELLCATPTDEPIDSRLLSSAVQPVVATCLLAVATLLVLTVNSCI